MNKIIEWFSKEIILLLSIVFVFIFYYFYNNQAYNHFCDGNYTYQNCAKVVNLIKLFLLITPSILFFSLINFFLSKKVFYSWKKFTFYYILLYLIIILITPWYLGDGFFNIQKFHISYLGAIIYSIISLILITYKSFKKGE